MKFSYEITRCNLYSGDDEKETYRGEETKYVDAENIEQARIKAYEELHYVQHESAVKDFYYILTDSFKEYAEIPKDNYKKWNKNWK